MGLKCLLYEREQALRQKLSSLDILWPSPVMEPSDTQALLARDLQKDGSCSAAAVVKNNSFVANEQGIMAGSEVIINKDHQAFTDGMKLCVERITDDGFWCKSEGVTTAVCVPATLLVLAPTLATSNKKRKLNEDEQDADPMDLPTGLSYVLASPAHELTMLRGWVLASLFKLCRSCNPACDVLLLAHEPRQVVVAKAVKAGDLVLLPYNPVLLDTLEPDVALSPLAVRLEVVQRSPGRCDTTEFFIRSFEPTNLDTSGDPVTRTCVCPYWFIQDLASDARWSCHVMKREMRVVIVSLAVKGSASWKKANGTQSLELKVPVLVNSEDLAPGVRLVVS
jgi:hypothetical protein